MIHHDELLALAKKYTPRGMRLMLPDGMLCKASTCDWEIRYYYEPRDYFCALRVPDATPRLDLVEYELSELKRRTEESLLDLLADAKR